MVYTCIRLVTSSTSPTGWSDMIASKFAASTLWGLLDYVEDKSADRPTGSHEKSFPFRR